MTDDLQNDLTELETLIPASRSMTITKAQGGSTVEPEELTIAPLTIGQIGKIAKPLGVIIAAAGKDDDSGEWKVADLATKYPEEIVAIVAAAINKPVSFVNGLRADIGMKVAIQVFEVNVPFFVQALGPILAGLAAKFTNVADGLKGSKGSATADT